MAEEIVDLKFLIKLEFKGESNVVDWCMENKLIPIDVPCPKCRQTMKRVVRKDISDGYVWRCRFRDQAIPHDITRSVRRGSLFGDSKMKVSVILQILYMWFQKLSNGLIEKELHVSSCTVTDWKLFCRKVCQEICRREKVWLGGPGAVVEIGEKKFIKQRMDKGRCVDGRMVIGGIERDTNKCFFTVIENQTKLILLNVIKENILPGSTLVSDCWETYDCVSDADFMELETTHGFVLKSPQTTLDTNNIENEWAAIKKHLTVIREVADYLESHLAEYVWRRRNVDNSQEVFMSFLSKITEIEASRFSSQAFSA